MLRQFVCTFAVAIISTAMLTAADWTVFHGPQGDNKSPDTGLLKKWDANGPKLLWTADFIGGGYSNVAVSGDKLYISGNVKRDGQDVEMIFCLDSTGKPVWEKANGPAHMESRTHPGTRSTPTVDGDFVYGASALGEVTCFDAKTGDKKWGRNLLKEYEAPMPRWILGHSVVVDGDNLICMTGGAKALAVALNKKTGETVTEYAPVVDPAASPTGYTTPFFFEFEGIRVLAVMSNATVEGYDPKTGKRLLSIPWRNRTGTNATMPIYRDGNLFLSTGYGFGAKGFKLSKNADGTIKADELFYTQAFDNHHGGIVLVGDYVYGTVSGKKWGAINFKTGEVGYLTGPVNEEGAVHFADGLIYGLSYDSRTVVLWDPKPTEYVELSRFELPNDEADKCWAHPVVINGKLYIRHANYLYCYDVKAQ